jgi:hypothetical protein
MARSSQRANGSRPKPGGGLLAEDHSEIKVVPAEDRQWWDGLTGPARARVASNYRKKWTDEETRQLVLADPDSDDYYELAARMGRTPGGLRWRRSAMVHLLRDEYGSIPKAQAYLDDPKQHHKWADIGQVYRVMRELGLFDLPVHEQFALARHLPQPTGSWRGDGTSGVMRDRATLASEIQARLAVARERAADGEAY